MGFGFRAFAFLPELVAIPRRQSDGRLPKLAPGSVGLAGSLSVISRHIEGAALTVLGPGDIEVRPVAAGRIAMTSTVRIAAAARGFRQAALDHGIGRAEEFAEKRVPTHINILGKQMSLVKRKSTFGHGFHMGVCENSASERSILRREVASGRRRPAVSCRHIAL